MSVLDPKSIIRFFFFTAAFDLLFRFFERGTNFCVNFFHDVLQKNAFLKVIFLTKSRQSIRIFYYDKLYDTEFHVK